MQFISKLIICLFAQNIFANPNDEIEKPTLNKNSYLSTQIKNTFKKEWQKFFKTFHHGHDLTNLNKIKINDNKFKVHKLLGSPVTFAKNSKVEYYVCQINKKILLWTKFEKGRLIRIEYDNYNKVIAITETELKKTSSAFPINDIEKRLTQLISEQNIEI